MTDFHKLTKELAEAEKECERLYTLWAMACDRRKDIAAKRNRAWCELVGTPPEAA